MELSDNLQLVQIGLQLTPYIVKLISPRLASLRDQDSKRAEEAIGRHLTETVNWASKVQIFGMSVPQETGLETIALNIFTEPRRFQGAGNAPTTSETDLRLNAGHILLLGEPGSGKSTTLKRIALAVLMEKPIDKRDVYQYPLVIRLRELSEGESIFTKIADILGLNIGPYEVITKTEVIDIYGKRSIEETKHTELRIGHEKIENVVPTLLNESKAILLLDGLDELNAAHRKKIRDEVLYLGLHLTTSKIILSCRTGDYTHNMEIFNIMEICPLNNTQIQTIATKWLGDQSAEFVSNLKKLPYFDVTNRPLLLTQLLIIYRLTGYLPEQPSQIYSRLVNLLLESWDTQRGIKRISKYAGFNPQKKSQFLAALSYQLTYKIGKTSFTEQDLHTAFEAIHKGFRLPASEASQVVTEIQTHTGIFGLGQKETYEFSHLSLQEYLCAEYVVHAHMEKWQYLINKPAPLAVATALSANPGDWLGALILNLNLNSVPASSIASLLSRVNIERPGFQKSELLGSAIILLFKQYGHNADVCKFLEEMLTHETVIDSLASVMRWYKKYTGNSIPPHFVGLSLVTKLEKSYATPMPPYGAFPRKYLKAIIQLGGAFYKEPAPHEH